MRKIIFISLLAIFIMMPASAVSYTASQLGLDTIDSISPYSSSGFLVTGSYPDGLDNAVVSFYTIDPSGSAYTEVYNHTIVDSAVSSTGDIFFIDTEAQVFKVKSNPLDMDDYDLGVDVEKLADLAGTGYAICVDASDNIYVGVADKAYKLTAPTYSAIEIGRTNWGDHYMMAIAPHPDGVVFASSFIITANNAGSKEEIGLWNGTDFTYILQQTYTTSKKELFGIASTENGDVYYTYKNEIRRLDYSDNWAKSTVATLGTISDGLSITDEGVIYVEDADSISTYLTVGNSGGYGGFTLPSSSSESANINASVSWEQSTYSTGDTATISYSLESEDYDEYDYYLKVFDHEGLKQTFTLTNVTNNTQDYTFLSYAVESSYLVQLTATDSAGDSDTLAMDTCSFTDEAIYELSFNQASYSIGDTMTISYSDLPTDTQIYLRGSIADPFTVVYSQSYYRTGTGEISLSVPSSTATDYTVFAISNGYTLDSDHCDIAVSESEVRVYGTVYDAQSGATIENAHILINGTGPLSNEVGRYSAIIEAGAYPLVVSATGYNTQSYSSVSFMVDTNRNFYMSPESVGSSSSTTNLYGVVRDYETGGALQGAMLTVTNSTGFTKTTFSSSTGFFQVSGLLNNSAYSVYSSLEGYDNYYNASITVTGMTWLEFSLVDEDYSLGTGSDDSTTTTDRPGRAAAEQTLVDLEGIIPGLIMVVVMIVFMNVIKRG
jgi:hypothetical protein